MEKEFHLKIKCTDEELKVRSLELEVLIYEFLQVRTDEFVEVDCMPLDYYIRNHQK